MKLIRDKRVQAVAAFLCAYASAVQAADARNEERQHTRGLGRIDLDLASTEANVNFSRRLAQTVSIRVGEQMQTVAPGQMLTPAQAVAAYQVMRNNTQSIVLGADGNAIGGTVDISPKLQKHFTSMNIPQNVTVVSDASRGVVNIRGDFNNNGTFLAVSTRADVDTARLNASNILNNQGALLSSVVPTGGIAGFTNLNSSLNLSLRADNDIINAGSIVSSGALETFAGRSIVNALPAGSAGNAPVMQAMSNASFTAGQVVNSGLIASQVGNINIASQTATTPGAVMNELGINNIGGVMSAVEGSINVGSTTSSTNIGMIGGDWLSKELNVLAGAGEISANLGEVTGRMNSTASISHVTAATDTLVLGDNCITGDPTFANTGNILIDGLVTVNEALAIIAGGDITATADGQLENTTSAPTYLIAGATITSGGGAGGETITNVTVPSATPVTMQFDSANGGNIDFTASTAIQAIKTAGGDVFIFANANGTGTGNVWFNDSTESVATSNGISNPSGQVTIFAGGTGGTSPAANGSIISEAILTGDINTSGNGAGNITIRTAQPTITSGPNVTFQTDGTTTGTFGSNPTVTVDASVSVRSLIATGTDGPNAVGIFSDGSNGGGGGAIQINSGGTLSVFLISANGGNGGDALAVPFSFGGTAGSGGNGGDAGQINLSSVSDMDLGMILANGGTGGQGGDGAGDTLVGGTAGNGGDGGSGGILNLSSGTNITHSASVVLSGGDAGDAGDGGLAATEGNGGDGGDGGSGGAIDIETALVLTNSVSDLIVSGGSGGDGGTGNVGGSGGTGASAGSVDVEVGSATLVSIVGLGGSGGEGGDGVNLDGGTGGDGGAGATLFLNSSGAINLTQVDVSGRSGGVGGDTGSGSGGDGGFGGVGGTLMVSSTGVVSVSNSFANGGSGGFGGGTSSGVTGGGGGFGGSGGSLDLEGSSISANNFAGLGGTGGQGGANLGAGFGGEGGEGGSGSNVALLASGAITFTGDITGDGGDGGAGGISGSGDGGYGGTGGSAQSLGITGGSELSMQSVFLRGGAGGFAQTGNSDGGGGGEGGLVQVNDITGNTRFNLLSTNGGAGGDSAAGFGGAGGDGGDMTFILDGDFGLTAIPGNNLTSTGGASGVGLQSSLNGGEGGDVTINVNGNIDDLLVTTSGGNSTSGGDGGGAGAITLIADNIGSASVPLSAITANGGFGLQGGQGGPVNVQATLGNVFLTTINSNGGAGQTDAGFGGTGGSGGNVDIVGGLGISVGNIESIGGNGSDGDFSNPGGGGGSGGLIDLFSPNGSISATTLYATGGRGGNGNSGGDGGTSSGVTLLAVGSVTASEIYTTGGDGGDGIHPGAGPEDGSAGGTGGAAGNIQVQGDSVDLQGIFGTGGSGGDASDGAGSGGTGGTGGSGGEGAFVELDTANGSVLVNEIVLNGGSGGNAGNGGGAAGDGGLGGAGGDGGQLLSTTVGGTTSFQSISASGGDGGDGGNGSSGGSGGNGGLAGIGGHGGTVGLTADGSFNLNPITARGGAGGDGGNANTPNPFGSPLAGGDGAQGGGGGTVNLSSGSSIFQSSGFTDLVAGAGGTGGLGINGGSNGTDGGPGSVGTLTAVMTNGSGTIGDPAQRLVTTATNVTFDATSTGSVYAYVNGDALLIGNNVAGIYDLVAEQDLTIDSSAPNPAANELSLKSVNGDIALFTDQLSVLEVDGRGGRLYLEADQLLWSTSGTTPMVLTADGTDFGGFITVRLTGGDIVLDDTAGGITLSAVGASGGALEVIASNGDILFVGDALNFAPLGPNGDGGILTLTAEDIDYSTATTGAIIFEANGVGTGRGGNINITLTAPTTAPSIGLGDGQFMLSATGTDGGGVSFTATNSTLTVNMFGINVSPSDIDGDGGEVGFSASTIVAAGGGTLVIDMSANPAGSGRGGAIGIDQTGAPTTTVGLAADGADFQLIANGGTVSGSGGFVSVSSLDDIVIDPAGISVATGKKGGDGGTILVNTNAGTGDILVTGSLNVSSKKGAGGNLIFGSGGTTAFVVGSATTNGIVGSLNVGGKTNSGIVSITTSNAGVVLNSSLTAVGQLQVDSDAAIVMNAALGGKSTGLLLMIARGGDIVAGSSKAKLTSTGISLSASGDVEGFAGDSLFIQAPLVSVTAGGNADLDNKVNAAYGVDVNGSATLTSKGTIDWNPSTGVLEASTLTINSKKGFFNDTTLADPAELDVSTLNLIGGGKGVSFIRFLDDAELGDSNFTSTLNIDVDGNLDTSGTFGSSKANINITGSGNLTTDGGPIVANELTYDVGGTVGGVDALSVSAARISGEALGIWVQNEASSFVTGDQNATDGDVIIIGGIGTKKLTVEAGSSTTATDGGIFIQNLNATKGSIFIGAGADIITAGAGGGDVEIYVGAPATVAGPLPENLDISGFGGTVSFGTNGITANGPINELVLKNADIVFSTGGLSAKAIVLDGGVYIEADPPVPLTGTLSIGERLAGSNPLTSSAESNETHKVRGGINALQAVAAESTPALSSNAMLNDARSQSNELVTQTADKQNDGLSTATISSVLSMMGATALVDGYDFEPGEFSAHVISDGDLGLSSEQAGVGHADLMHLKPSAKAARRIAFSKGSLILAPKSDVQVETAYGDVSVGAKSLVLLMATPDSVAVYNLDDWQKGAVQVTSGGKTMSLSPGRHAVVSRSNGTSFDSVNPAECFGYRNLNSFELENGMRAHTGEFSIPWAIQAVKPLRHLVKNQHAGSQQVVNHLMKTTAVLMHMQGAAPYQQVVRPRVAAYNPR